MHSRVYKEYERLCSTMNFTGSVLEVGAIASEKSLLCMLALENAREKVGINLRGPKKFKDFDIIKGNANSMIMFEDNSFDLVLCNALLEHDKYFWKTLSEIKRVTRTGGYIIIGTPGFTYYKTERIKSFLRKLPLLRWISKHHRFDFLFYSTLTFEIHNAPGDYYRFSPQAYREVFFDGFDSVDVHTVMVPPRVIGIGRKK
jgi:ubiquinone/menaquinone biosynthesis C-methylase UbiE